MMSKFYIYHLSLNHHYKTLCYLIIRVVHPQNTLRLFNAFKSLTWFGSEGESQVK